MSAVLAEPAFLEHTTDTRTPLAPWHPPTPLNTATRFQCGSMRVDGNSSPAATPAPPPRSSTRPPAPGAPSTPHPRPLRARRITALRQPRPRHQRHRTPRAHLHRFVRAHLVGTGRHPLGGFAPHRCPPAASSSPTAQATAPSPPPNGPSPPSTPGALAAPPYTAALRLRADGEPLRRRTPSLLRGLHSEHTRPRSARRALPSPEFSWAAPPSRRTIRGNELRVEQAEAAHTRSRIHRVRGTRVSRWAPLAARSSPSSAFTASRAATAHRLVFA